APESSARFLSRCSLGSRVGSISMRALNHLYASAFAVSAEWPAPKAPGIAEADGHVEIPNVAIAPTKNSTDRAVFDATRPADKANALIPALNMAGSEWNAPGDGQPSASEREVRDRISWHSCRWHSR